MAISPIDVAPAPDSAPSTSDPTGSSALGKDEFVKLLMAQLSNQDPTSPQDGADFIAQLAQFASVEMQQASNDRLEALLVAQASRNQTATAELIGKDVQFASNEIEVHGGVASKAVIRVPEDSQLTVTIKDSNGVVVRRVQPFVGQAPDVDFTWDGLGDDGLPVGDGVYTIEISAEAVEGGASVDAQIFSKGHVTGVSFEQGFPELKLGERTVGLPDVLEILEASS